MTEPDQYVLGYRQAEQERLGGIDPVWSPRRRAYNRSLVG